jgi:lipopolysaccharide export system protein LptA
MTPRLNPLLLLLPGLLLPGLLFPAAALAQITDTRLPISLDADSTDYDGMNSMLVFRGLRLSQGPISIEADEGRASKLDFEDSIWEFTGNVIIDVEDGHIEAHSANLEFVNHDLKVATIEGAPATFELKRPGSDDMTYAEAGRLKYYLETGTIEFSEEAKITESGNQISSSFLVYNIDQKRISAQSSGDDSKVKIIYTPVDILDDLADEALSNNAEDDNAEDPEEPQSDSSDAIVETSTEDENP